VDQNNNSYRWFKDAFPLKALFSKQGLVYERLVGTWAYDIAQSVTDGMLDENGVVHDRSLPLKYEGFSKDYATGKGVLLRCWTAWSDPKPSNWQTLVLDNAKGVWNNRVFKDDPPDPNDPTRQYQFGFNWNPKGRPPASGGEPDFPGNDQSPFSQLILQVSGMAALNAALLFAADQPISG
jgi:hypothetical protein